MNRKIRVLLVDDHNVVRQGLRLIMAAADDMEVVGEAEDGRGAVELCEVLQPDVVIMDIVMPLLNGLETTRKVMRATPHCKVLVLSSFSEDEKVKQMIEAGASGFLVKQSAAGDLLRAIREVHEGGGYLCPAVCKAVMEECRRSLKENRGAGSDLNRLTPRETEVLQLVAEGFANKQIADVLGVNIKTVEKHRQDLMNKLNIHQTASLTRFAVEQGMVSADAPPSKGASLAG
jgi:DNA-binding NarL/FixJ family response regulator